ncbi:MAG: hypothetical protein M3384_01115 [Acidobacteriota bacterium]|nr:hypothetical protein [Acidobacteriota bacterium]
MNLFDKITTTTAPTSIVLIRLMVGAFFLSEGIRKFLFPAEIGAGNLSPDKRFSR